MRFDLITIFPQFFDALDLSMLGKAQAQGLLEINVCDLRDFASGKHRSVDDTPAGGGAGMVMKPDVWGSAIDAALLAGSGNRVLAIPTPSGVPLTQRIVEDLANADQIIVACGRYEGIDARVGEHYREAGVDVLEFSLGDYVLNGGEVAGIVLVEAVGRLLDGFMGNPESLVEESHGAEGLLEYPIYTHPKTWRGLDVPAVLSSGNHQAICRWRRDRALEKTARHRPDLVEKLDPTQLDADDKVKLALEGWLASSGVPVTFDEATLDDVLELHDLAARTFPDACPDHISEADRNAFISEELSQDAFSRYIEDPNYLVLVARAPHVVAYSLVARSTPSDMGTAGPQSAYLSKCYADRLVRGSGVAGALMRVTLEAIGATWQSPSVTVATNISNKRAAKFYRHLGFRKAGRRHFRVGDSDNIDDVFVLDLTAKSWG